MRVIVCIKQVPDTETKIKLNSDQSGIDESGVKWIMNPYDEFAVEEALKLKEAGSAKQVTILSLGPKKRVVDSIRTGLAMGADDGIVIDGPEYLDAYTTAKALAAAIQKEDSCDLVLSGKLAIDDNAASVSQYLAEFLEVPHATVVSKLSYSDGSVEVEREVEGGTREVTVLKTPAVVAANKGLNTPRYASLPGIMKAKKKPMKELTLEEVGVSESDIKTKFINFQLPPEKAATKIIEGEVDQQVKELVRLLREEAKVL